MTLLSRISPMWRAALAVFVLDQASKLVVVHLMGLRSVGDIEVLPPWLSFRMAWNTGVNFGLFAGAGDALRWILIGLAVVICGVVIWLVRREGAGRWTQRAAGLLIGGALANVLDRLLYGAVADFINVSCCGIDNPYAFNIADMAIFVGALGMVLLPGGGKTPPASARKNRA